MTETQALFLTLAGLYLIECIRRGPRGSVAFLRWLTGLARIFDGGRFYGNDRFGFYLASPIPAPGRLIVCQQWPVSFSPIGIYSYVAQAFNPGERHGQPEVFLRYEDVKKVKVSENQVLIDEHVFVRVASVPFARHLAECITRLRDTPLDRREPAIRAMLDAALDVEQAGKRYHAYQEQAGLVAWPCGLLFFLLFVAAPVLTWRYDLERCWLPLLLGVVILVPIIVGNWIGAHRRLYPQDSETRLTREIMIGLYPLAAIRANDDLSHDLLATYHPLAAARVLCSQEEFERFARATLLDLEHPILPACPSPEPEHIAVEEYFRKELGAAVRGALSKMGVAPEALTRPPAAEDEFSRSYCPRCRIQYMTDSGECQACGGQALRRLERFVPPGRPNRRAAP